MHEIDCIPRTLREALLLTERQDIYCGGVNALHRRREYATQWRSISLDPVRSEMTHVVTPPAARPLSTPLCVCARHTFNIYYYRNHRRYAK
ncbi:hypothetical protein EVAR_68627_1 [Eumeta japonica]|uniref:Uncharacterized protein n=1 Tax=Eumeta variegata TaxID=151549 RepID=A0A4C2ACH1_EUMVA|nr:hypothetical protein EVAR_68627_1 [Eumeta japonica]